MKTAFNIVSEVKVAFEMACTNLSKAVQIHKGVVSKAAYNAMAVKHLSIINEVLKVNEEHALALDKALSAYDAPAPTTIKSTSRKAGTVAAMVEEAKTNGYLPKGKQSSCPSCRRNNRLVTFTKSDETLKACPCGYRKVTY